MVANTMELPECIILRIADCLPIRDSVNLLCIFGKELVTQYSRTFTPTYSLLPPIKKIQYCTLANIRMVISHCNTCGTPVCWAQQKKCPEEDTWTYYDTTYTYTILPYYSWWIGYWNNTLCYVCQDNL